MKLEDIRNEIDAIDDKIAELYVQRMNLVREVAVVKKQEKINLSNTAREKEIKDRVTTSMPEDMKAYGEQVFDTLFETSKAYQTSIIKEEK